MTRLPCPHRLLIFISIIFLLHAWPSLAVAADNPEFRPALIGNGPKSLVNLIDVQKLLQQGQGDALVMFSAFAAGGRPFKGYSTIDNATPDSKLLQKEVLRELDKAEIVPAIAHHESVLVTFRGTVVFSANSKPHLRIFANQERDEIANGNDFVAPQLLLDTVDWDLSNDELRVALHHQIKCVAELSLRVDASGKTVNVTVAREEPPKLNFGDAARKAFAKARFIPGFRNGKPVECSFHLTEFYHPYHYLVERWR